MEKINFYFILDFLQIMFRSWVRSPLISNRLIHTVARQKNEGKKKVIVLGAGWYGLFLFLMYLMFTIDLI